MTQKDYVAIAGMLSEVKKSGLLDNQWGGEQVFDAVVSRLADIMKQDNKKFKRNLFMAVSNGR